MDKPIRVGIIDDHAGVRVAIRQLLARAKDITVIGEGANGEEAIQLTDREKPDVLLLDVELPVIRGDEVVQRVQQNTPEVKVLALSSYNDPMYILGMMENGAAGYITKEEAPQLLLEAIHTIVHDQVKWISPKVASQVSKVMLDNTPFTGRELEILRLITLDESDNDIIHILAIDGDLLNRHINLLMSKLGVNSREELKSEAQLIISTNNS